MMCGDLSPVTVTSNLNHYLLLLPIDLIMSHGACNYDKDHYFVKAINSLISSNPHDSPDKVLESYYNNHQPANILAAHRLGGGIPHLDLASTHG